MRQSEGGFGDACSRDWLGSLVGSSSYLVPSGKPPSPLLWWSSCPSLISSDTLLELASLSWSASVSFDGWTASGLLMLSLCALVAVFGRLEWLNSTNLGKQA